MPFNMLKIKQGWLDLQNVLLKNIPNKNWFIQAICTLIISAMSFIPIYLYIFFRWLFDPITFWQNLALFVIWMIALGWIQVIFWIMATVLIIILYEKRRNL